jgi:hypothetical protein
MRSLEELLKKFFFIKSLNFNLWTVLGELLKMF